MTNTFREVKHGALFTLNGNVCVKVSSRTARMYATHGYDGNRWFIESVYNRKASSYYVLQNERVNAERGWYSDMGIDFKTPRIVDPRVTFLNWQGETIDAVRACDYETDHAWRHAVDVLRRKYWETDQYAHISQKACASWYAD